MLIVPPPRAASAAWTLLKAACPWRQAGAARQGHPYQRRSHPEDVEHPAVVEGLVVDTDMIGLVQVHLDAHVAKRRICLWRPRAARLPVGARRHPEDSGHVLDPLFFAPPELGAPVFPTRVLQVDGDGRLLAMRVRVIADVVPFQGGNHILPAAPLEHARLFTDDLERRVDVQLGQQVRQPLRRIVILRQDVVFRIEPERDVDGCGCARQRPEARHERGHQEQPE